MNVLPRFVRRVVLSISVAALSAPAWPQASPIMRYNTVVESTYVLERCGELTPARQAWLKKLTDIAKRPLDWSDAQWAAHDAALAGDLGRLYPSVAKVRCEELVRNINQEMKNPPAN